MERDFETVMIEQCAPVLAGLKPAGLFRYETRDRADLARRVAGWNAQLNPKGLQVRVLRGCIATRQYLVYGYRLPEDAADCSALLDQLSLRLCCAAEAADFPHEIGVFLGYPLEDVEGFIRYRGKCFTCCGCWKSYGDPAAAQQHFDQLAKCTAVYLRMFHSGTPILKLAVAA